MSLFNQLMGQQMQAPQTTQPQVNPQAVANVKNLMQLFKSAQNPTQALQNLVQQNPNIAQIMQAANGMGGLKNLFYQQAQQMGIDPDAILSQLK